MTFPRRRVSIPPRLLAAALGVGLLGGAWVNDAAVPAATMTLPRRRVSIPPRLLAVALGLGLLGGAWAIAAAAPAPTGTPSVQNATALLGNGTAGRAVPVTIAVDGRKTAATTTAATVGQALANAGVRVRPLDWVTPAPDQSLRPGLLIQVTTVTQKKVTKTVPVAFATVTQLDANLVQGNQTVLQTGRNGVSRLQVLETFANGHLVSTENVGETVVTPAVSEVVGVGTAYPLLNRGGVTYRYSKTVTMLASGYWADPSWSNGITATGMRAQYGVVAVDPRVIPLGTRLYIPGYGPAIAADTGSAIQGNRIDLCFNSGSQAINFGMQWKQVYILAG